MMIRIFTWPLLYIFLMILCPSERAVADPYLDVFGIGPRVVAMGGAGTALSEDASGVFYNPANLSRCRSNLVTIGYNHVGTLFSLRQPSGDLLDYKALGNKDFASIGACFVLPYDFSFGVYFSAPILSSISLEQDTLSDMPRMAAFGWEPQLPSVSLGLSYAILKNLSVGVGANVFANIDIVQDTFVAAVAQVDVANQTVKGDAKPVINIKADVAPVAGILTGVQYAPIEQLSLGLTFRSPTFGRFHVRTNASGTLDLPQLDALCATLPQPKPAICGAPGPKQLPNVTAMLNSLIAFSPMQLAFGTAVHLHKKFTLAADVTWYNWSNFQGPYVMLTPATEDAEEFNFGFSDTVVPRVGIEYVFVDTYSLRTGYAFRTSPIGPPQRKANLLDNTTHHFSFGFGVLLPSIRSFSFSADLFSAFDYMPTKAVNKAAKYGKYSYYAFGGFAWNAGLSITAGF